MRRAARLLCLMTLCGLALLWSACPASLNPNSECSPEDARCEDGVAVECVESGGKTGVSVYEYVRTECGAGSMCFEGQEYAVCAVAPEPCDAATFEQRCQGELQVVCGVASGSSPKTFQIQAAPCVFGNVCVAGGCGLAADVECDPDSFTPTCTDGTPTTCQQMGESQSDRYREAYAAAPCADGNACVTGPGYAGCSHNQVECDPNTFEARCDGDKLISCGLTFGQVGGPDVRLEHQIECPNGCDTSQGFAGCKP